MRSEGGRILCLEYNGRGVGNGAGKSVGSKCTWLVTPLTKSMKTKLPHSPPPGPAVEVQSISELESTRLLSVLSYLQISNKQPSSSHRPTPEATVCEEQAGTRELRFIYFSEHVLGEHDSLSRGAQCLPKCPRQHHLAPRGSPA